MEPPVTDHRPVSACCGNGFRVSGVRLATVVAAAALLLVSCGGEAATVVSHRLHGPTMGTHFNVTLVAAEGALPATRLAELEALVVAELESVNGKMSTYLVDSEISRFNRAESTEPFPVSSATAEVVAESLAIAELSNGAFDITLGPLINAYGFGPDEPATPPSEGELAALLEAIGYRHLEVDLGQQTVRKALPGLECDPSGIAKGFAVDRVAEALAQAGVESFLVEVGGEVRARGRNAAGQVWRLGIERPEAVRGTVQRIVPLADRALATSGDYRNYREIDGVRFSHLLDPRTGRPIRHRLASVSVVHESCARADGLATALMVLGEDEALRMAESHDLAILLLVRNDDGGFREVRSAAFDRLIDSRSTGA
ncbi:MAG: FAD:protein FMN transferase [Acidobacteriota bacterium]